MSDPRWTARYAFSDEIWRDRPRVIVDARLEEILRDRERLDPAAEVLLGRILPIEPAESVWMVVDDRATAARLSSRRRGTTFVARDDLAELLRQAAWEVLVLDVSPWLGDRDDDSVAIISDLMEWLGIRIEGGRSVVLSCPIPAPEEDVAGLDYEDLEQIVGESLGAARIFALYRPSMAAVVDCGEVEPIADPSAAADLELTEEGYEDDETIEISLAPARARGLLRSRVPSQPAPSSRVADDDDEDDAEDDDESGDPVVDDEPAPANEAPVIAAAREPSVADAGEVAEVEGEGDAVSGDSKEEGEVPLVHDNTLGTLDPAFEEYIVIAAAPEILQSLAEAMNLIELPVDPEAEVAGTTARSERSALDDPEASDGYDVSARLAAVEVENVRLQRELARLQTIASSAERPSSVARQHAIDLEAALTREQALKWRVGQLEAELAQAIARPVSELEAEIARLRAELLLAKKNEDGDGGPNSEPEPDSEPMGPMGSTATGGQAPSAAEAPSAPEGREEPALDSKSQIGAMRERPDSRSTGIRATHAVIRVVDGLVRRIERGGIGTLQLRQELVDLRKRLQA